MPALPVSSGLIWGHPLPLILHINVYTSHVHVICIVHVRKMYMCIHVRTMYKLLDMRGKHTCTCMYMSKSMNHNSLGCEQPCIYHTGLNVNMANVHDTFLSIPGIISCAGVTGSGYTCTCTCMYMSKSMNHNSLGCEQPCIYHRGLNVKMPMCMMRFCQYQASSAALG